MTAFFTLLKTFTLLALLTVDVGAASLEPSRVLRIEPLGNMNVELLPTRKLQGTFGAWFRIVKTNIVHQPVGDKTYEKVKQLKDRITGNDN